MFTKQAIFTKLAFWPFYVSRDDTIHPKNNVDIAVQSRVQFLGTKGQKFLHCPGTSGQAQNLAPGQDSL